MTKIVFQNETIGQTRFHSRFIKTLSPLGLFFIIRNKFEFQTLVFTGHFVQNWVLLKCTSDTENNYFLIYKQIKSKMNHINYDAM